MPGEGGVRETFVNPGELDQANEGAGEGPSGGLWERPE